MLEGVLDSSGFKAGVDHAISAFLIVADAVSVPVRRFHQLLEGLGVAFTEQITGLLPAEHGTGRVTPRRTVIRLVTGEEVEEHARLAERPLPAAVATLEDIAEQLL